MQEVRQSPPSVRNRSHVEPLDSQPAHAARTLPEKLARYSRIRRSDADLLLLRVFTVRPARPASPRASVLLRAGKRQLVASAAREAGVDRYTVYQVLRQAIARAAELGLHLRGSRRDALRHARWMLIRLVRLYGQGASPQIVL